MAQHILIEKEYSLPIEEVFNQVTDHENFGRLIGTKILRTTDSTSEYVNGEGSVRRIHIFPLPSFEETVTAFKNNEYFEYKITQGSPIKNHIGKLSFSTEGETTRLKYTIDFDVKIPLPGFGQILKTVLQKQISEGLDRVR
jgi:uncharacterized protein YndB with AHSA1/START domain